MSQYEPALSLGAARERYFVANKFGPDGGYQDKWVNFKVGPIPFPFPNTRARVRAVKFHDLHHIVTGYETNFRGELEISAWEIASGCGDMLAAWQLNLGGMGFGLLAAPRRVWRAFLRGRHSRNLYRQPYGEALLGSTVGAAKHELGLDIDTSPRVQAMDVALFTLAAAAGVIAAFTSFVFFAPVALIVAGPLHLLAKRSQRQHIRA